eukprot:Plantae.Rhodophyta-Purpureofilum_apyrenoidigerum.ctg8156.p1 GENE.Plantae.Rhodophyta-Purpureofilum_apyrenoidigerum.ctg8156~~Plantae.Rhodophyta-Purpureofilum_apyrenoidigerum.ctg8156.p1  ORF type:complete len:426 (-),score=60.00 Plantae.Rhodophyta-Purpureofilum_apyrenoidigerum.ctg8156:293-1570(-)
MGGTTPKRRLMQGSLCTLGRSSDEGPQCWNPDDRDSHVEVTEDGMTLQYRGLAKSDSEAASARTDKPIPTAGVALFYFEAKIINAGDSKFIGFGMCLDRNSLNRLPGWDHGSLGYHSDDGMKFCGRGNGETYGPKCSTNDVVGMCWNLLDKSVFFTNNGAYLGVAFRDIEGTYFPTVGLRSRGAVVEVNFGKKPFVYDIESYAQELRSTVMSEICNMQVPGSFNEYSEIILNYLLYHGYAESAKAFAADVGKSEQIEKEIVRIERKKRICTLIRRGQLDEALTVLKKEHPFFFENPKSKVLFSLKCQQLVEMSRTQPVEARLAFAKEHLRDYQDMGPEFRLGLQETIVLLAYKDPMESPFAHLMDVQRRDIVAAEYNNAIEVDQGRCRLSILERVFAHTAELMEELRSETNGECSLVSIEDFVDG